MTKKLFSLAVAFFFLQSFSYGIGNYKPGDELFVHASGGLVMRKTAEPKGERILSLNYGDAVKVLQEDFKKKPYTAEDFKGFKIKGFWVKVTAPDGQEGYVFDGYLSSYRVPVTIVDDTNSGNSLVELFLLSHTESKTDRIPLGENAYRRLFKNGAQIEVKPYEGGSSQQITFQKSVGLEEAYFIGKALWLKDMKVNTSYEQAKGKITVTSEDGQYKIEVSKPYGFAILNMQHAD